MTFTSKLSTLAAVGALLAAPTAMAQQSGTSEGTAGQTSHGMSAASGQNHPGVGTAQSPASNPAAAAGNAQNTTDTSASSPQGTGVNTGGQGSSSGR